MTCPCGRVVNALSRHVQSVTRSVAGVRLSPDASAFQIIISNNSYAHDEQGVNPGHIRGFDGVLYKLTVADALISSVKVSAAPR